MEPTSGLRRGGSLLTHSTHKLHRFQSGKMPPPPPRSYYAAAHAQETTRTLQYRPRDAAGAVDELTRSRLDYDIIDYRDDYGSGGDDSASLSEGELLDLSSDWTAATSFDGDFDGDSVTCDGETTVAPSLDGRTACTDTSFDISLNRYSDMTSDGTSTVASSVADTRTTATSHQLSFDLTLNRKGSSERTDDDTQPDHENACELLRCLWTPAAPPPPAEGDHHAATLDLLHGMDEAAAAAARGGGRALRENGG
eukprot:CAMPEP_0194273938 /NCGR_PEP_ID=MMETSP0169-20130528/7164_1 /TAXON_ID=218684 /ORGANISM="Corethron pennatum, Strain L29A3" /LENGTH=252 /DNA_ID=CAMNT_0039017023 /DNA_START=199 /DNA_END=954 /DNA_ORIENTATION=-